MRRLSLALLAVLVASMVSSAANLPAIVEAAKTGNREALKALVQKATNVNDADGDGTTALHWASYRNDLESADLLLKAGAKVNAKTDLGVTPLWTASQNGSDAMVKRLLQAGADPNLALLAGETPLMVAARSGYAGVVEQLAAKGAHVNARGTRGQTALMWAASQKHPDVVRVLLAHKPDINAKSETWSEMMGLLPHAYYSKLFPHGGETALMFAARMGDADSARLLLAAGASPNDADAWGVSATTLAAHSNFTDVVELLLDKGADANAAKAGFTALHNAIMQRNERMVKALLDHGANPNARLETWTPTRRTADDRNFDPALVGASPLWLAARITAPAIMRLLLEHGADPLFVHHGDVVPEAGMQKDGTFQHRLYVTTPLMAAVGMGAGNQWSPIPAAEREALTLEAVKLAAVPGVDLNAADTDGRTAIDAAQALRYESVVKFLTERGAKPPAAPAGGGRGGRGARGAAPPAR
jgi:ankyrin repeat protein